MGLYADPWQNYGHLNDEAIRANRLVIDTGLQRFMAKRMNATSIEIASSHVSLLSHPEQVSNLILRATGRQG